MLGSPLSDVHNDVKLRQQIAIRRKLPEFRSVAAMQDPAPRGHRRPEKLARERNRV
jgi:hypothetical protein